MTSSTLSGASQSQARAVLLVASMGCAMTVLDTNIVGIILPTLAQKLGASFADIEWVISAYVLCFSSFLLPAGSLADRFGRKKVFLIGILVFALASAACGAAGSASFLYCARAFQGIGAAFLLAPALAIIGHSVNGGQQPPSAWATWGGIMGLTMVVAPLAGGIISSYMGWRWAFYINVPVCLLLAFAVLQVIEESDNPKAGPVDVHGISLFVAAMFSLTWALIIGPIAGWVSPAVLLRVAASLVFFACLVQVEKRKAHPMLDLQLFHSGRLVAAVVAMFAYAATAQVMTSILPLLLQNIEDKSALAAGVGMLPFALAMLVLPRLTPRLAKRLQSYQLLTLGLVICALGNVLIAWAVIDHATLWVSVGMLLLGSGGGILNGETQKAIMGNIPLHRAGMGSGVSTTARFSGILLGFASLSAILSSGIRSALQQTLPATGLSIPNGFIDAIVAGDNTRALALYPLRLTTELQQLTHQAYRHGFALAMLTAATLAGCAAILVFYRMRSSAKAL